MEIIVGWVIANQTSNHLISEYYLAVSYDSNGKSKLYYPLRPINWIFLSKEFDKQMKIFDFFNQKKNSQQKSEMIWDNKCCLNLLQWKLIGVTSLKNSFRPRKITQQLEIPETSESVYVTYCKFTNIEYIHYSSVLWSYININYLNI